VCAHNICIFAFLQKDLLLFHKLIITTTMISSFVVVFVAFSRDQNWDKFLIMKIALCCKCITKPCQQQHFSNFEKYNSVTNFWELLNLIPNFSLHKRWELENLGIVLMLKLLSCIRNCAQMTPYIWPIPNKAFGLLKEEG